MKQLVAFGRNSMAAALSILGLVFLGTGCSTTSTTPAVGTGASFKGPVGLQLYSLRDRFKANVPDTVKTVQGFGIHEVELASTYNMKPEVFRQMLVDAGLQPISAHVAFERLRDDPEAAAKEAQTLGLQYLGVAWIPHKGKFDVEQARVAAKVFNHAGEVFAKYGIKAFYHCHGYEFQPDGGTTPMDVLIQETNPKVMSFEMDICWVVFPGEDPVNWFNKYGSRWELVHLKDLKKGVATGSPSGGTDVNNDVALGTGQMNWPAILKAARKAGVKHYFIEDESASSVTQIPQSLSFLRQVSW